VYNVILRRVRAITVAVKSNEYYITSVPLLHKFCTARLCTNSQALQCGPSKHISSSCA